MNRDNPPLLEASNIDISFNGRQVLDQVSLRVHRGDIVTLIGPNGAGKSTLVRIALGLLKPDRGHVRLATGVRIGYMPQRLNIDGVLPLTVRRFLTLAQRCPEAELYTALEEVGCRHLLDSPMQSLSGGETQRVLLARAILRKPDLLILDEPVQGVDVNGQEDLYRLISQIRARHGCGILMISHDLHLVMSATDEVVCINRHVCCSGSPDTVRVDPSYVALFGRAPLLTPYSHHHDHAHDAHGNIILGPVDKQGANPAGEHSCGGGCNHG